MARMYSALDELLECYRNPDDCSSNGYRRFEKSLANFHDFSGQVEAEVAKLVQKLQTQDQSSMESDWLEVWQQVFDSLLYNQLERLNSMQKVMKANVGNLSEEAQTLNTEMASKVLELSELYLAYGRKSEVSWQKLSKMGKMFASINENVMHFTGAWIDILGREQYLTTTIEAETTGTSTIDPSEHKHANETETLQSKVIKHYQSALKSFARSKTTRIWTLVGAFLVFLLLGSLFWFGHHFELSSRLMPTWLGGKTMEPNYGLWSSKLGCSMLVVILLVAGGFLIWSKWSVLMRKLHEHGWGGHGDGSKQNRPKSTVQVALKSKATTLSKTSLKGLSRTVSKLATMSLKGLSRTGSKLATMSLKGLSKTNSKLETTSLKGLSRTSSKLSSKRSIKT